MFVIFRERKIYIYTLPYEQNLNLMILLKKTLKLYPI